MTLYCYRDNLDKDRYSYFGVNLYFVWDEHASKKKTVKQKVQATLDHYIQEASAILFQIEAVLIHTSLKREKVTTVSLAIAKWIVLKDPIVEFVTGCISNGISKTPCYNMDVLVQHQRGKKGRRKQNVLALHDYLSETPAPDEKIQEALPPYELFEAVRDHFADELEIYMGMEYSRNDISECEGMEWANPGELVHGDFLFEIGELQKATFRYWGHFHAENGRWKPYTMFNEFDIAGLNKLLKAIT
jgi:hypothetical protein